MSEQNPTAAGVAAAPAEPDWAKLYRSNVDRETAHQLWSDVVAEMSASTTLTIVNGPAIKRYVIFQVECERQARNIGMSGVIRKAPKTKVPMVHPAWSILKQAAEAAATLEAELAISPRRRNNGGKVQRKDARTSRADTFLGKRKPDHLRPVS
jgi:hypothetical protein